ncbi:hypothetical protein Mzhil_1489 [Methanosalsum zhilinae DSM 4017]|uniref:CcmD family protein n=1 Tax=Methanosalsum zhilinae (strain DSM 4017 / NBRC 107636 / OCM 62 / WeN5) TaxID=679901 RepID=F7XP36_METZD|nr:CcmD family protein [Methanosalsum zhilinae]AEH61328.1 hypothetical protein Mzhil_1489 [Methanosalsum zhilinae DSM 4017]
MNSLYLAFGITGLFILLYTLYLIQIRRGLSKELMRLKELKREQI